MGAENIRKPHHKSKPENFRVDASPQLLLQKLLIILKRLHVSIIFCESVLQTAHSLTSAHSSVTPL